MNDKFFTIIDFDGWNVGLTGFFGETFLEFDSFQDCADIATHWDRWILWGDL